MQNEIIDINEKHFLVSSKKSNGKPENFGLKKVKDKECFVDNDGNHWKNEILWDLGWGNESGFVRLPEPSFEQLWVLLTKSEIKENELGAAELLYHYPKVLKIKLEGLFSNMIKLDVDLSRRLSHLDILNHVMNHSETKGKQPKEVTADFQEWKKLKDDFDRLKTKSSSRISRLFDRI